jgi:nitrogen fixation-related uncharacterized protein
MISVCVVVFLGLVAFIFWLAELGQHEETEHPAEAMAAAPAAGD